jgi:hypothetical protein
MEIENQEGRNIYVRFELYMDPPLHLLRAKSFD